jgi:hypothetical protein
MQSLTDLFMRRVADEEIETTRKSKSSVKRVGSPQFNSEIELVEAAMLKQVASVFIAYHARDDSQCN